MGAHSKMESLPVHEPPVKWIKKSCCQEHKRAVCGTVTAALVFVWALYTLLVYLDLKDKYHTCKSGYSCISLEKVWLGDPNNGSGALNIGAALSVKLPGVFPLKVSSVSFSLSNAAGVEFAHSDAVRARHGNHIDELEATSPSINDWPASIKLKSNKKEPLTVALMQQDAVQITDTTAAAAVLSAFLEVGRISAAAHMNALVTMYYFGVPLSRELNWSFDFTTPSPDTHPSDHMRRTTSSSAWGEGWGFKRGETENAIIVSLPAGPYFPVIAKVPALSFDVWYANSASSSDDHSSSGRRGLYAGENDIVAKLLRVTLLDITYLQDGGVADLASTELRLLTELVPDGINGNITTALVAMAGNLLHDEVVPLIGGVRDTSNDPQGRMQTGATLQMVLNDMEPVHLSVPPTAFTTVLNMNSATTALRQAPTPSAPGKNGTLPLLPPSPPSSSPSLVEHMGRKTSFTYHAANKNSSAAAYIQVEVPNPFKSLGIANGVGPTVSFSARTCTHNNNNKHSTSTTTANNNSNNNNNNNSNNKKKQQQQQRTKPPASQPTTNSTNNSPIDSSPATLTPVADAAAVFEWRNHLSASSWSIDLSMLQVDQDALHKLLHHGFELQMNINQGTSTGTNQQGFGTGLPGDGGADSGVTIMSVCSASTEEITDTVEGAVKMIGLFQELFGISVYRSLNMEPLNLLSIDSINMNDGHDDTVTMDVTLNVNGLLQGFDNYTTIDTTVISFSACPADDDALVLVAGPPPQVNGGAAIKGKKAPPVTATRAPALPITTTNTHTTTTTTTITEPQKGHYSSIFMTTTLSGWAVYSKVRMQLTAQLLNEHLLTDLQDGMQMTIQQTGKGSARNSTTTTTTTTLSFCGSPFAHRLMDSKNDLLLQQQQQGQQRRTQHGGEDLRTPAAVPSSLSSSSSSPSSSSSSSSSSSPSSSSSLSTTPTPSSSATTPTITSPTTTTVTPTATTTTTSSSSSSSSSSSPTTSSTSTATTTATSSTSFTATSTTAATITSTTSSTPTTTVPSGVLTDATFLYTSSSSTQLASLASSVIGSIVRELLNFIGFVY